MEKHGKSVICRFVWHFLQIIDKNKKKRDNKTQTLPYFSKPGLCALPYGPWPTALVMAHVRGMGRGPWAMPKEHGPSHGPWAMIHGATIIYKNVKQTRKNTEKCDLPIRLTFFPNNKTQKPKKYDNKTQALPYFSKPGLCALPHGPWPTALVMAHVRGLGRGPWAMPMERGPSHWPWAMVHGATTIYKNVEKTKKNAGRLWFADSLDIFRQ